MGVAKFLLIAGLHWFVVLSRPHIQSASVLQEYFSSCILFVEQRLMFLPLGTHFPGASKSPSGKTQVRPCLQTGTCTSGEASPPHGSQISEEVCTFDSGLVTWEGDKRFMMVEPNLSKIANEIRITMMITQILPVFI